MGTMTAFYRISVPTMTPAQHGPSFSVQGVVPFSVTVATLRVVAGAQIDSEAVRSFVDAGNQPIKRFFYTGTDLTSVQYRTAADVLMYTATLAYTGTDLTTVTLVRASDSAQWIRTLTYVSNNLTEMEAA